MGVTCGWYRQRFETLLDGPVEIELPGAIVQGNENCRFLIHIHGSR
ncbi:MAG: hypothetical protein JXA14_26830 [Anaerolineae bacterium]|nr:hypothetical protein [Anaerolineae bacterium]